MPTLNTQGISQYFETFGSPERAAVMLITGLGGAGTSWGSQVGRFAERYHVIVPDHRGTGKTTRSAEGYDTKQLARDMAAIVEDLRLGPIHVVGASTGGAIAQYMALDHPQTVKDAHAVFNLCAVRCIHAARVRSAEKNAGPMGPFRSPLILFAVPVFTPIHARTSRTGSGMGRSRGIARRESGRPGDWIEAHRYGHGS